MKQGLFLFFAFCVISNAYAEADCLQRPSCEELGYTQTVEECAGRSILPCPFNIADTETVFCEDIPCEEKCKTAYPLFAGQANTKAAIDQIGNKALAAYAASQFYVGDKNGDFGQGKWYLPSIGEWMYFYGTDTRKMTADSGETGAIGDKVSLINNALKVLSIKHYGKAETLDYMDYWSSSEILKGYSWAVNVTYGFRNRDTKDGDNVLRCSLLLKNIFNPSKGEIAPKVGDVMYLDKTYGSAEDYDRSKTPVGVISSVSKNSRDVTILNLKDLTFSSSDTVGNFDPENPYGAAKDYTQWSTNDKRTEDITGIEDVYSYHFFKLAKASGNCPCQFYLPEDDTPDDTCTGASKCKDSSGNCITCYSSCSAYDSSYKDSQPSGQSCSTTSVMIVSGNGATATSKTCYYNCSTIDTCTGANKCKDSSGNCITCYKSCEDAGYLTSRPSDYHRCSSTSVWIGSGNGSTATSTTCYYSCSTCGGDNCCMDPEKGVTQLCYPSCSGWGYDYPADSIPDGYECQGRTYRVLVGEGKGKDGTYVTCIRDCYEIPNCIGTHTCRSRDKCVECYASCSAWGEALFTDSHTHLVGSGDSIPEGAMCDSQRQNYYIGSGNGANATLAYCGRCIW